MWQREDVRQDVATSHPVSTFVEATVFGSSVKNAVVTGYASKAVDPSARPADFRVREVWVHVLKLDLTEKWTLGACIIHLRHTQK
jgi:hypothetical protein